MRPLSVVIPTLNESRSLPLLLADLARWPWSMQLLVVDGGSRDATVSVAHLAGAEVLSSPERGRGQQLCLGSANARESWLLVLHADSRLHPQWPEAVSKVINAPDNASQAWTFDFQVEGDRLMLRMLERAVALRSRWLQRPYGDQGLLIHRDLLEKAGGYRPGLDGGSRPGDASERPGEDPAASYPSQPVDAAGATGCAEGRLAQCPLAIALARWRRPSSARRCLPSVVVQLAYQKAQRCCCGSSSQP